MKCSAGVDAARPKPLCHVSRIGVNHNTVSHPQIPYQPTSTERNRRWNPALAFGNRGLAPMAANANRRACAQIQPKLLLYCCLWLHVRGQTARGGNCGRQKCGIKDAGAGKVAHNVVGHAGTTTPLTLYAVHNSPQTAAQTDGILTNVEAPATCWQSTQKLLQLHPAATEYLEVHQDPCLHQDLHA